MISNPRHGSPPRLMAHQPTRFPTTQESSIRVYRPDPVSFPLSSQPRLGTAALLALVRWIEARHEHGQAARADDLAGAANRSPTQVGGAGRPACSVLSAGRSRGTGGGP